MFDKQWESKWAGKKGEKSGIKGQKWEQGLDHVGAGFYSEDGGEPWWFQARSSVIRLTF